MYYYHVTVLLSLACIEESDNNEDVIDHSSFLNEVHESLAIIWWRKAARGYDHPIFYSLEKNCINVHKK